MMLILPSGLGVGDVVYFNVNILNDEAVEEMFENFTVHLNDTARVSVIGTRYSVVDIKEDETDGEFKSAYLPPRTGFTAYKRLAWGNASFISLDTIIVCKFNSPPLQCLESNLLVPVSL